MKVIIVENELYLAQSIASRLGEYDFEVEIYSSAKDAQKTNGDIYLLSTNLPGQNFMPLVRKIKDKITIMMVNYINNDTVGEPLKNGATDYIVKPFMVEELLRKIELHSYFKRLELQNQFHQEFLDELFRGIHHEQTLDKLPSRIIVQSLNQRAADRLALDIANEREMPLCFISLGASDWKKKAKSYESHCIAYIVHLDKLDATKRQDLFTIVQDKQFIISYIGKEIQTPFATIKLDTKTRLLDYTEILTIDEYIQQVIKDFQHNIPDTELSRRLGVSRKSLWERRKKYDIKKHK